MTYSGAVRRIPFPPVRLYVYRLLGVATGMSAFLRDEDGTFATCSFAHTHWYGDVCLGAEARRQLLNGRDPEDVFWSSVFLNLSLNCAHRNIRRPALVALCGLINDESGLYVLLAAIASGAVAALVAGAVAVGFAVSTLLPHV